MSDDSREAPDKATGSARVAGYAPRDEGSVAALNDLGEKTDLVNASDDAKTRICKGIADVKRATYGTRSEPETR